MTEIDVPLTVRKARLTDVDEMVRLSSGPIAGKRDYILESLTRRNVFVACVDDRVAGYLLWDRAFFGRPFVWLLGVDRVLRRRGIASHLLQEFEACCPGETLFTSTNESNCAMRSLLSRLGFRPSGRLENLDPGDPELFYYKAAVE